MRLYLVCENCYKNKVEISNKTFDAMSKTLIKARQYVETELVLIK